MLINYVRMLHEHLVHILPLASQAAALGPSQFKQTAKILQDGPSGVLLPELAVGLVLLQLKLPLHLVESDCIPLVGELVERLDQFNRLAPGSHMEDEDDLAWSDVKSKFVSTSIYMTFVQNMQSYLQWILAILCVLCTLTFDPGIRMPSTVKKLITPEDIENHNKEGGAWGIVHGKVYDLRELANEAPCEREKLLAYAGQDATKAFEAIKHSDFAHETAQKFVKGTYSEVKSNNN